MSGFIFYLIQIFMTENLAVNGEDNEEGEKSFFASQGSKCKHKHSSCLNERYGMGRGGPPEPANEARLEA